MKIFAKFIINWSSHGSFDHSLFIQEHFQLIIFISMSTFFNPPFWKSLHIVSWLIFTVLEFHKKSFCIRFMFLIMSLGTDNIWAINRMFDNATQKSEKWWLESSLLTPRLWRKLLWIQFSVPVPHPSPSDRPSPVGNYMLKINNNNTRTRCEVCPKLTLCLLLTLNIFHTLF